MIENWTCPKCTSPNHPRRDQCWQCGYPRESIPKIESTNELSAEAPPTEPNLQGIGNQPIPSPNEPKDKVSSLRSLGRVIILACGGIFLLVAATLGVFTYLNRPQNTIIGTWEQVGEIGEIISFHKDGTITTVDFGVTIVGNYEFLDNNTLRIDILGTSQIFDVNISGNMLSLSSDGTTVQFEKTANTTAAGVEVSTEIPTEVPTETVSEQPTTTGYR